MTDRIRTLVVEALEQAPDRPADLDAVRARATHRLRRQRTTAVTAALVLVVATAIGVNALTAGPTVPVIGETPSSQTALRVQLCPPMLCDDGPTLDEALEAVQAVEGVEQVTVVTPEELLAMLPDEERGDMTADMLSGVLIAVPAEGADLYDTARSLKAAVRGSSVRVNGPIRSYFFGSHEFPLHGYDPAARVGDVTVLATTPVGDLLRWPVVDGGLCLSLADRTTCTGERLMPGSGDTLAYTVVDGWSCTFGIVGGEVREVEVVYLDDTVAQAQLAPPGGRLVGGFAACVEGTVGPNSTHLFMPTSESGSAAADTGRTLVEELRPPGGPTRSAVAFALVEQFDEEALVGLVEGGDHHAAGRLLEEQLTAADLPAGVVTLEVVDVETDQAAEFAVRARLDVTTRVGEPFCLSVEVGPWVSFDSRLPPGPCDPPRL